MAAHKFVIAFSFGLELHESRTMKALHVLYMLGFAAMSGLGVGIGLGISASQAEGRTYTLIVATFQGEKLVS